MGIQLVCRVAECRYNCRVAIAAIVVVEELVVAAVVVELAAVVVELATAVAIWEVPQETVMSRPNVQAL